MNDTVYLATLPNGFFISSGQSWLSVDVDRIESRLSSAGFSVVKTTIDKLDEFEIKDQDFIIYTSSPVKAIREYLKSVLYFPSKRCHLVPRYEFLMAHEDKGFQEILKKEMGINSLRSFYHYDLDAYEGTFPVVFKTVEGAGSSGVKLIRSQFYFEKLKNKLFSVSLFRRLVLAYRKLRLSKGEYKFYKYRHMGFRPFVFQSFVADLDSDYKILIFGDKYFGLKRYTKKGDFRASGSGNFDLHSEIPDEVLDFSEKVFERMDVPFLSLDVVFKDGVCQLIEYQALNFGPLTLNNSEFYYVRDGSEWLMVKSKSDLDECYADAYLRFLINITQLVS